MTLQQPARELQIYILSGFLKYRRRFPIRSLCNLSKWRSYTNLIVLNNDQLPYMIGFWWRSTSLLDVEFVTDVKSFLLRMILFKTFSEAFIGTMPIDLTKLLRIQNSITKRTDT